MSSSGNLSALRVLSWVLDDIKCEQVAQTIKETSEGSGEETITHEVRDVFVITRHRLFHGAKQFQKATGSWQNTFSLITGPQTALSFGTIGRKNKTAKFICASDELKVTNLATGAGVQSQVWKHLSPWRALEDGFV